MGFGRAMTVPCDVADEEQVDAAEAATAPDEVHPAVWAVVAQRDPRTSASFITGETLKVSGGYPLSF